jgi:hypothetical protein
MMILYKIRDDGDNEEAIVTDDAFIVIYRWNGRNNEAIPINWLPKKHNPKSCLTKGCSNRSDQGTFIGDLCSPCHEAITTGNPGKYSLSWFSEMNRKLEKLQTDFLQPQEDFEKAFREKNKRMETLEHLIIQQENMIRYLTGRMLGKG